MKKVNHIINKIFAKYAEKNLVLIVKIKNIKKLEIIVIILENIEFLLKVLVVFHNLSTCDYHFIIYEIVKQFEGQFECLRENTEKCITFSVPIKKKLDNGKTVTYKIKFTDSFRLCQAHYQILLIMFLKGFTIINGQIVSLALITYQPKMIN